MFYHGEAGSSSSGIYHQGQDEDYAEVSYAEGVPAYTAEATAPAPVKPSSPLNIRPGDIVIAVMGITGSGKSTFISHFAEDVVVGHTLEACTSNVGIYECEYDADTKIFFVDTPGFDDTYKSDTDILREIADWLSQAYGNNIQLTGIIYLHRILDVRLGGSAMKNLRMFKKLCGNDALSSVVLATTWWTGVDAATGARREEELAKRDAFWAGMIAKGSKMFRQNNGTTSARQIVDYLVQRKRPVTLKIQEELVDDKKTLDQTGAGMEVETQLAAQRQEFEKKIAELQAEMKQAMIDRDVEFQEQLLVWKKEEEEKMRKAEEDRLKLQADRESLRREMDAQLAEERMKVIQQMQANNEKLLQSEHQLRVMALQHSSELEKQKLSFEVEKERAERQRLAQVLADKKKKEDESCSVM